MHIENGFNNDWIAFQSIFQIDHDLNLELKEKMCNPLAFAAEMLRDVMYFHQAMKEEDSDQFVSAAVKEVNGHVGNQSRELVKVEDVPKDAEMILWAMMKKRNLLTNKITKYKER